MMLMAVSICHIPSFLISLSPIITRLPTGCLKSLAIRNTITPPPPPIPTFFVHSMNPTPLPPKYTSTHLNLRRAVQFSILSKLSFISVPNISFLSPIFRFQLFLSESLHLLFCLWKHIGFHSIRLGIREIWVLAGIIGHSYERINNDAIIGVNYLFKAVFVISVYTSTANGWANFYFRVLFQKFVKFLWRNKWTKRLTVLLVAWMFLLSGVNVLAFLCASVFTRPTFSWLVSIATCIAIHY